MKRLIVLPLFATALAAQNSRVQPTIDLKPAATVKAAAINEMSGIVASRKHKGVYWVHNDSGDKARFFAIKSNGTLVSPAEGISLTGAKNSDWEDIALGNGTLYLCDVGNNDNRRKDLTVYAVPEPSPSVASVVNAKAYRVQYEDQKDFPPKKDWYFDCEAAFALKGKLYFLTKHRMNASAIMPEGSTNLYVLDKPSTTKVNLLKKVDSKARLGGWVCGADVSPNGKWLAVVCNAPKASVWLFALPSSGDKLLSGNTIQIPLQNAKQAEGICFGDDKTLLITNEQREIFRISVPKFESRPRS